MPIENLQQAAQQVANFLNSVVHLGGLRLKYRISAGAAPESSETPEAQVLNVELAGPDAPMLTQRGGELLRALEHIAIQILRLDIREHDLVSFDALNFKALRAQEIQLSAETAAERVRTSGQPFSFPPSNSRERRMLHLCFKDMEDVESHSLGEGQERYLVVYPKGRTDLPAPVPTMPARSSYGDRDNRGNRDRGDRSRGDRDRPRGGGYGRR
ncbi:MAG TPA: R3H domain-containing nucleic acid-binding protein [Acidobacteriaceae bacterium]|jgi:spoIIIJ-associated protein|nr:R3H domain-containing nucleic acid-binding protein [Acidobacteriaceae bacterium]